MNLRVPGPTPVPPAALAAAGRQMINHRGPEFAQLLSEATAKLQACFRTRNDLLILTGSGTGAMEAAVVNLLSPGDRVLSVCIGAFGERWAEIARAFGADVRMLEFPWGEAADPDAVAAALRSDPTIKAVLVTHNETSTGVTNDLEAIAGVVRQSEALLMVDAISSAGAIELESDGWGCDVVIGASQKAWMAPPGVAMVSMSERAWRAHAAAQMPRFYWDFTAAKRQAERGMTPWTPAVSVIYALAAALSLIETEGLPQVIARHRRVGARMRGHVRALGLGLLPADDAYASDTTTAIRVPPGIEAAQLLRLLREEHGVVLAGGQGRLAGKIVRVGHLGWVQEADVDAVAEAMAAVLPRLGWGR